MLRVNLIKVCLKVEDTLRPHVEEQVEDGEVGQETVFLLIDLIIGLRREIGVRLRVFGIDGFTEVLYLVYS